jgi:uncharacterized protein YcbX
VEVLVRVAELWRYPVKSMAGERLDHAQLSKFGVFGDRVVQVRDATGRLITSRTHPSLLGFRARFDEANGPIVNDLPWRDPQIAAAVEEAIGLGTNLVADESNGRFDVLPLLVATDGAIAAFGYDGRRLRPNIVIGGVQGLAERTWEGHALRIGDVLIGIHSLRGRCVMTTFDPDSLEQDRRVLKKIVTQFDGRLALNCWVMQGGTVRVGDEVELLRSSTQVPTRALG